MHDAEFEKHELQPYRSAMEACGRDCTVGMIATAESASYFGGFPLVNPEFVWPCKNGYPLNFIGQLPCSQLDMLPADDGHLLFFYDNRHFGYSKRDLGHAVVLHQHGHRQLSDADLPTQEVSRFFGLLNRSATPFVYKRVGVTLTAGRSYPPWQLNTVRFPHDGWADAYYEFMADVQADIQIGGYPNPIQSGSMEADCARILDFGEPDDWCLLLQLREVGNMLWGDAGALYWFIHKEDLSAIRFDRVWMIFQCY